MGGVTPPFVGHRVVEQGVELGGVAHLEIVRAQEFGPAQRLLDRDAAGGGPDHHPFAQFGGAATGGAEVAVHRKVRHVERPKGLARRGA